MGPFVGDGITPTSALATTHTARRSTGANLLLDGVRISEIMQLGGWKNEATLRHYLLAGGIQLARLSADGGAGLTHHTKTIAHFPSQKSKKGLFRMQTIHFSTLGGI